MKAFQKIMIVAGFALLAACGGNADKFVGDWVDPSPKKEEGASWLPKINTSNNITIKASGSSKVEITATVLDRQMKNVYEVDGSNILDGSRVIYTLEGNELVKSSGIRLVRK